MAMHTSDNQWNKAHSLLAREAVLIESRSNTLCCRVARVDRASREAMCHRHGRGDREIALFGNRSEGLERSREAGCQFGCNRLPIAADLASGTGGV